jgi:hypothetical protein
LWERGMGDDMTGVFWFCFWRNIFGFECKASDMTV